MSEVVLPDEVLRALELGGWVADGESLSGSRFKRGAWVAMIEPSPSVFGSWKWTVEMTDRNEVRTSYCVTKVLSEFLR